MVAQIRIIGDTHGKFKQYRKLTRNVECSIQLGDFGFKPHHMLHLKYRDSERHKIIFGNHDDTSFLKSPHSLGNHGIFKDIFCIRGAWSIDQKWRTIGINWFQDEELNMRQMTEAMDAYEIAKPSIVITHDCPEFMYSRHGIFEIKPEGRSTPRFLEHVFELHRPDLWIYGHHHDSQTNDILGTEFRCLDELETLDLEL